jgi:hypothetical protein
LPKVAWLGLNPSSRQAQLFKQNSENLGCLAANCAIRLGHLQDAMEFLDLSHSIFWQQGLSLRSDLGDLREKEPALAENLERVSHQLEAGYFSDNDFSVRGYNVEDARHRVEAIGIECCHMVGNWEELVEQVRRIPQFEYFLRPIPFS